MFNDLEDEHCSSSKSRQSWSGGKVPLLAGNRKEKYDFIVRNYLLRSVPAVINPTKNKYYFFWFRKKQRQYFSIFAPHIACKIGIFWHVKAEFLPDPRGRPTGGYSVFVT